MSLGFITGVHFTKGMLKAINGITFLYNPAWEAGQYRDPTFPAAFFHVKSMHEVHEAEVSQKQLLFYNSQKKADNATTIDGVMNIVADNIVVKPKQYKLDILVPFGVASLLSGLSNTALNPYQLSGVTSAQFTGGEKRGTLIEQVASTPPIAALYEIMKLFVWQPLVDISNTETLTADYFKSMMYTDTYNKNSLQEMFESRGILKLKTWDSWKYKYVVITNMDITKEGTDENYFEASLTLQEMPIMTVRNVSGIKVPTYVNVYRNAAGEALKKFIDSKEQKK